MPTKEGRVTKTSTRKSSAHRRVQQLENRDLPLVERTNALPIDQFISQYIRVITPSTTPKAETPKVPAPITSTNTTSNNHEVPTSIAKFESTGTHFKKDGDQHHDPTPLDIYSASSIPPPDLEACLDLIEQTSSDAYASSGIGWSRPKKRKEMQLPDMKYLLVRGGASPSPSPSPSPSTSTLASASASASADKAKSASDEPSIDSGTRNSQVESKFEADSGNLRTLERPRILGFLSFMVTYEDGKEVVYCYEIHLSSMARGKGLGGLLMGRMEGIGREIGLEKAMLTVFKSNVAARQFYKKIGYEVDENSPMPRTLRNGTVKEYDYEILSKRLK